MPGRIFTSEAPNLVSGSGCAEHASAECLCESARFGLNHELDAEHCRAADRGGAAGAGLATEVIKPRPHLVHPGGQVTVNGDLDDVQHERDSAWGERNPTIA